MFDWLVVTSLQYYTYDRSLFYRPLIVHYLYSFVNICYKFVAAYFIMLKYKLIKSIFQLDYIQNKNYPEPITMLKIVQRITLSHGILALHRQYTPLYY